MSDFKIGLTVKSKHPRATWKQVINKSKSVSIRGF